jgi:hypothetical protein
MVANIDPSLALSSASALPAGYIDTTSTGAKVDNAKLVSEKERKLASGPRTVEDPIAVKARAENVS